MKGYLLKEASFVEGEGSFIESSSSENNYAVAFEDDMETGYFYAIELDEKKEQQILDALHIYEVDSIGDAQKPGMLKIIWSTDWLKCALLINNYCHAVFDFANHGGYNRNEFPPPNDFWTMGERKLTDAMLTDLFT